MISEQQLRELPFICGKRRQGTHLTGTLSYGVKISPAETVGADWMTLKGLFQSLIV